MDKNVEKIIKAAEGIEWTVTEEGENQYLFSKFSPAGQDFNVLVEGKDAEEVINSIYERYESFDVSEETYLWLDDTGHGKNGAPYNMRDLYNDFEWCENEILELHRELGELFL